MPQRTEMHAPPFRKVHSIDTDKNSGDIIIRFETDDEELYKIQIDPRITAVVVSALLGQLNPSKSLDATAQHTDLQMLHLSGFRPAIHPDGRPALILVLEGDLELGVVLPEDQGAVEALQNELSKVQQLITSQHPSTEQH